jgi:SAM-dependent methyltransferase/ABC-type nitrate/sulfonate/bicarbonate transport system substrate-binding protein
MRTPHFRVGGVPEHFNYPWQYALEHDLCADRPFSYSWADYPGGTGAMLESLQKGELDVALVLTEGAVTGIAQGLPARILGIYVASPLLWGIHVHPDSARTAPEQLRGARFAISRYNSGSHLMAFALAKEHGWPPEELAFEVVGDFAGAQQALDEGRAEVFLWEKYTTKPTVDAGRMKRIGVQPTPWPCFVLLGREAVVRENPKALKDLMAVIRQALHAQGEKATIQYISRRYQLEVPDVQEWFGQTRWLCRHRMARHALDQVQDLLLETGMIGQKQPPEALLAPFCLLLEQELSPDMYQWRVESVHRALAERGKACGPLELEDLLDLGHLDQYHYHGAELSRNLVEELQLDETKSVLDIGSGVGGTARVLAQLSGCRVVGVEVQAELNELADELTQRVGLSDRVHYITGRAEDLPFEHEFDHFISLLVYLHIPNRAQALQKACRALKPGGRFVIEDFVLESALRQDERSALEQVVSGTSVTDWPTYRAELEAVGFSDLQTVSRTDAWRRWTRDRYRAFAADADRQKAVFSPELVASRAQFYRTVARLFEGGRLGGLRITGRKP